MYFRHKKKQKNVRQNKVFDIFFGLLYNFYSRFLQGEKLRAVVQRVLDAKVEVENKIVGKIDKGFVVFLGIGQGDTQKDLDFLVKKICGLRIFEDENEKMNLSPSVIGAEMLVISNFTLFGNLSHGFRPDFFESMPPKEAKEYVEKFVSLCHEQNAFKKIQTGIFGADMKVSVTNDGPVTIILDTREIMK